MSNIQRLYDIERSRDVESITIDGIKIWAFIRNYAGSQMMFRQDLRVYVDKARVWHIVRNIFYGARSFLRSRYDCIIISSSDQRKNIEGEYIDRMDFLGKFSLGKFLHIEFPRPDHYKKGQIPTEHIASKYAIYFLEAMYGIFKYKRPVVKNEKLLQEVLRDLGVDVDYHPLIKKFFCQYRVMNWVVKRFRIKRMFIANAYTNMGYVLACKENDCHVIEFQHGIVGAEHYAYNVYKDLGRMLYPDYLLVFGNREKEIFTADNYLISADRVLTVGNFYIDHIAKATSPQLPEFIKEIGKFRATVAVSLQDAFEREMISFVKDAAALDESICFILKPRQQSSKHYSSSSFPPNVIFFDGHNTYESIKECDFHSTITSTTAIESPSLGTRNILMNINNLSRKYYEKDLLSPVTLFANTPAELVDIVNSAGLMSEDDIRASNSEIIGKGYESLLSAAMKEIFDD
jgi:hypothetical protein